MDAKKIYSQLDRVWPDDNIWYDYLHNTIINYISNHFGSVLNKDSIYLNAGSGGSVYNLPGICYHVDVASNLIQHLPNVYVCSVEDLPFDDNFFDGIICVGSVINYCSALETILQFSRVIKHGGYLILEFERSQTAELWFTKDYNKNSTPQCYDYLGKIHHLWLYSESYIKKILKENSFYIINEKRIHTLSAIINKFTHDELYAGKYACFDKLFTPISYFASHNIIIFCQKY